VEHHADDHHDEHGHHGPVEPHESPWVVTVPLILLAIPAALAGYLIGPMLFGGYFAGSIHIAPAHGALATMGEEFHGVGGMMIHALTSLPFWFSIAGIATAWFLYIVRPDLPAKIKRASGVLSTILEKKYGFDEFNDWFFAGGARALGGGLWKVGDQTIIDGWIVNGSAKVVGWISQLSRLIQSGYIHQYAFSMIIGVFVLLTFWFSRN
jgi:NADH-quinone oxidoreductase subunit L